VRVHPERGGEVVGSAVDAVDRRTSDEPILDAYTRGGSELRRANQTRTTMDGIAETEPVRSAVTGETRRIRYERFAFSRTVLSRLVFYTVRRLLSQMRKRTYRVLFTAVLVLLLSFPVGSPLLSSGPGGDVSPSTTAPPADGITVITTQDAGRETLETAEIIAFRPNGSVLYYDDSRGTYFDVDPVPNTTHTVTYVATRFVSRQACPARVACVRNQLVRTNLSTGASEVLYERLRQDRGDSRWHDADRINETHYAIADLSAVDRVYIVNTSSGMTTWSWSAQSYLELTSGAGFGDVWTHINDVELLPDGRIMVSARNQDRILFIDRETGVDPAWTVGGEDEFEVLHEQHNPDYIPAADGGPAVLVADSENDRIVEYQRARGEWVESWSYRDRTLQWPRDADRLPNGHTLITDSNGDRVFEVDEHGTVVWTVDVALPYEAERLSTPDESGGGPSAAAIGLDSVSPESASDGAADEPSAVGVLLRLVDLIVPDSVAAALLFISPPGVSVIDWIAIGGVVLTVIVWAAVEVSASNVRVSVQAPLRFYRK
jgi:hypothetical protein